jgi:8-oxo-dGTP diphosphatase
MPKSDQGVDHVCYHVIPRTLVFLFNQKHQVLLLKGSSNKRLWAELYNGIGGHIEAGEDILEAAYRELEEETGIKGILLRFCAQILVDVSDQVGVTMFIFKGDYAGQDFIASTEGTLAWIDLDALDAYPLVEDLPELLPLIAAHQPTSPILIGKYTYGAHGDLEISIR